MTVMLSGGPLATIEVDATDWAIGARRYFVGPDGRDCTYWRYDQWQAVFEGYGRIE